MAAFNKNRKEKKRKKTVPNPGEMARKKKNESPPNQRAGTFFFVFRFVPTSLHRSACVCKRVLNVRMCKVHECVSACT